MIAGHLGPTGKLSLSTFSELPVAVHCRALYARPNKYEMEIFDLSQQDGTILISRLLQNARLPIRDPRRLPEALRDRLADAAIKQMQAQVDSRNVDPDWFF